MPNLGNRTVGQDPSAPNVRNPQQKGDEIRRSRGQDERGKKASHAKGRGSDQPAKAQNSDDEGANS